MLSWSAAITTRRAEDFWACRATRTTMGRPAMSASGLFGNRMDARRAGMRTVNAICEPGLALNERRARRQLLEFFVRQRASLFLQHDGDAVAYGVRKACATRDEFLLIPVVVEVSLGHRANQQCEQF